MKVKCPSCCEIYLETTETYNPDIPANGTMFRLLPEYGPDGHNWSVFPPDEWVIGENLECPSCGAPIVALDGRTITLVEDPHEVKEPVQERGRTEEGPEAPGDAQGQEVVPPNDAHVCPECGKAFSTSFALNGHMQKHKGGKGERG